MPLVLTVHGTDLMGFDKWPHLRPYAVRAMDAARKAICISEDNELLTLKAFPEHAAKVVRMRNGFNPDVFFPQQLDRSEVLAGHGVGYAGERLVLFAGKLTHFKGVDVLLDAVARYEAMLPGEVLTVIAGDGERRDELEGQMRRLGLGSVRFIGNVSQAELARLYNVADVDVVPSRNEPFGLVAVEAMACGTPVVASNIGGLPNFVNAAVGALAIPEDPDDLARCIVETLHRAEADGAWRDEIAAYASGNYSQSAIIAELVSLYEEARG
ncbi:MAG: glycosyltransferase [Actinomycetota bacterium]|nr:glycosyltransferase [Actinomycetota bacterium]